MLIVRCEREYLSSMELGIFANLELVLWGFGLAYSDRVGDVQLVLWGISYLDRHLGACMKALRS